MSFPNHSEKSALIFSESFDKNLANDLIIELIKKDLIVHKIKSTELEAFCLDPQMAINLLLSGLAAFYSNTELFGGKNSDNYKIKKKHFQTRGKRICQLLFG